ncbi:hypothetical protein PS15p_207949 [Mucor circinelloides]
MKVYSSNFLINCVFAVNVINNMLNYAERYQEFLKAQKESGMEIVGYARKSPVFVSKISTAGQPFYERDVNQDSFEGSDGSTVDLIEFLNSTKKKVILVALDYAGLSTNVEDLKEFLRKQKNITKILIDRLPITSEVETYETEVLLQDENIIKKFDCRTRPLQRSL